MRKRVIFLAALIIAGCSSGGSNGAAAPSTTTTTTVTTTTTAQPTQGSAAQFNPQLVRNIVLAFKRAGLPVAEYRCYTEEDDPNKLLGRPNAYVQKCNWHDRRLDDLTPEITRKEGPDTSIGGSIELFDTPGLAMQRQAYVQAMHGAAAGPLGAEWDWLVPEGSNLLLRVSGDLTKKQAMAYRDVVLKQLPHP